MLEGKIKKLEERCESIETELQEFYNNQLYPEYVCNRLVDLEYRSKICNLQIASVNERKAEIWE